jgi:hypothetical protein
MSPPHQPVNPKFSDNFKAFIEHDCGNTSQLAINMSAIFSKISAPEERGLLGLFGSTPTRTSIDNWVKTGKIPTEGKFRIICLYMLHKMEILQMGGHSSIPIRIREEKIRALQSDMKELSREDFIKKYQLLRSRYSKPIFAAYSLFSDVISLEDHEGLHPLGMMGRFRILEEDGGTTCGGEVYHVFHGGKIAYRGRWKVDEFLRGAKGTKQINFLMENPNSESRLDEGGYRGHISYKEIVADAGNHILIGSFYDLPNSQIDRRKYAGAFYGEMITSEEFGDFQSFMRKNAIRFVNEAKIEYERLYNNRKMKSES